MASRKLLIRVIGAPLLVAALLGILYAGWRMGANWPLRGLILGFAVVALHEVYAMMRLKGLKPARWLGIAGLAGSHLAASQAVAANSPVPISPEGVLAATVVGVLLWMVFRHATFAPEDAAATVLGFAWLWLTVYLVTWMPTQPGGAWWLLFLFATNKGSDMAAYSAGKLFGRHPFAPVVSPNKTWEGAVAGLVVGAGLGSFILMVPMKEEFRGVLESGRVVAAVVVVIAAQMGDLAKSAVKRWAGVKDSGRLLPEFGGALDMVDSFILSAPVAWLAACTLWWWKA
jgi:phosphatidate cytidylyltransferase